MSLRDRGDSRPRLAAVEQDQVGARAFAEAVVGEAERAGGVLRNLVVVKHGAVWVETRVETRLARPTRARRRPAVHSHPNPDDRRS